MEKYLFTCGKGGLITGEQPVCSSCQGKFTINISDDSVTVKPEGGVEIAVHKLQTSGGVTSGGFDCPATTFSDIVPRYVDTSAVYKGQES